jgi:capsular exopolysaccharide synthesis family protein
LAREVFRLLHQAAFSFQLSAFQRFSAGSALRTAVSHLPAPTNPDGDFAMYGPMEDSAPPASSFQVQRLLGFLLKYWWVPVLTLAVGLGAGIALVLWKPPTFVSKARMWETVKLRLPEGSLFAEDVQNFLGTQTELLQSTTLRELALARLKASGTNVALPLGKDGEPLPVLVRVAGSAKSSIFMLEATSSLAAYTQNYLNALMDVYLEYKRNIRQVVSGDTLASITAQVQRQEQKLKEEQDALMAFQRTNNYAILQQEGAIAGSYLATLKTKLSDLQLEDRLLKATALDQDRAASATTNTSSAWADGESALGSASPSGAPSERQTAFKEVELLKIQRAKLSRYLRPKHPKIVKLDADIERGEKLIEIFRRQNRDQLQNTRQAIQLKIDNVQSSIKEWESKVLEANSRLADAERLKLNVQREQTVYDRLLLLVQNVGISRNIDQETLAILERATPSNRSYTQEIGLVGVAGVGGLGLGLGVIVLLALRDDRFTSLIEISEKLGQNVVGQVPEVQSLERGAPLPLLAIDDKRHLFAESYRSLRSAILFMAIEGERPKVLLITSAVPNEGKSTVAANLARALALGGSRVVLVDADLRKGVLHQMLGLQREPGLADVLRQPGDLEKVIQKDSLLNFAFISSGHASGNSGDLFLGPEFKQLLARLRQMFDYVLIDSSPVFAAADATTLAPAVDGTLFVVRSRFSGARPVREALDLLYQRQAKVLGIVFNQADASARSYHYYKYADYHAAEVSRQ